MSDYNGYNNEDHGFQVNPEHREKRRRRGLGWMVATLALVAFIGGALVMKYLPVGASQAGSPTAASTAIPAAAVKAGAALPSLGAGTSVSLESGANIADIVKLDGPAVVGVLNKVKGNGFAFGDSNASGEQTQGSGSGVIISSDGYIVTNNHVVAGADDVTVILSGGEEIPAKVVGADAQSDLAVLKIDRTGLTSIKYGDSDALLVGDSVVAIGNPMGTDLAGTVTHGIVSGKNREINIDGYTYKVLQTDAAINPGNSGGALVNSRGELIGINNAKDPAAEGIGFAIPVNVAKPVIEQLIASGGIARPVLGISQPVEIGSDYASFYRLPVGVGITNVVANGPAAKAGLRAGDIIVEFDGQKVESLNDMRNLMDKHAVGDKVKVGIYRDSTSENLTVELTLGNSLELDN